MDVENCLNLTTRDVSSVGSERCFDRAEVTGSSPVRPTFFGCCYREVRAQYVPLDLPLNNLIHPFLSERSCYFDIVIGIAFHHALALMSFKQNFSCLPMMLLREVLHLHV